MREKIIKQLFAWLPVVLWALLIFRFSSSTIPLASAIHWQDFLVKKIGHVILFGTLAVLTFRGLRMGGVSRKRAAFWAIIMAGIYGATDEYHQMFTYGREPHIRDVFIDLTGAILIILAVYNLIPKFSKRTKVLFEKLNLI